MFERQSKKRLRQWSTKNQGVIPFSLKESFDVKRLMLSRPEDEARNEIVATLRGALRGDGVCPAECQSERRISGSRAAGSCGDEQRHYCFRSS